MTTDCTPTHETRPIVMEKRDYCWFYGRKNGCRLGDQCSYIHDPCLIGVANFNKKRERRRRQFENRPLVMTKHNGTYYFRYNANGITYYYPLDQY